MDAYYYSHMGFMEGTATVTDENKAVMEYVSVDETIVPIYFELVNGELIVTCEKNSSDLGFGANVSMDGTYILGEPVYTNADDMNKTFLAQEQEQIQELLGDKYEEHFEVVVTYGGFNHLEPVEGNIPGRYYSNYFPTLGYQFQLLFGDDGYLYFYSEALGFLTDNPTDLETIPDAFEQ